MRVQYELKTRHEEQMLAESASTCDAGIVEKLSVRACVGRQIKPARAMHLERPVEREA